jgi:uncharacterized protein
MNKRIPCTTILHPKSTLPRVCILVCLVALTVAAQCHSAVPRPDGAVNDFAGIMTAGSTARMERLAAEILQKTGTAVVVATFTSLDGNDPDLFANELYEAWGIGKKGEDKGVLILLAVQERRIRIETGFGVEGVLPDGLVGSLLDRYVVPLLKENRYEEGLFNAMAATGQILAKDAGTELTGRIQAPADRRSTTGQRASPLSLLPLLIIFVILISTRSGRRMLPFILLIALSGGRGGGRGGSFGGGGFSGGFGGFGGGLSGGGGAGRGF